MDIRVTHTTQYAYSGPVDYALQKIRLRPLSSPMQEVVNWSIEVTGGTVETSYIDHHGNHVDLISIAADSDTLTITAHGQCQTLNQTGVLGLVHGCAPLWYFKQATPLTTAGEAIKALPPLPDNPDEQLGALHTLSAAILDTLPYNTGGTNVNTAAEEALRGETGVCQDHAQIFVAAARLAGLPARYVSGYLMVNDRIEQDATHAWAEAYIKGLGWVGFDVSNGMSPDERYIRIAVGRDAHDAAPVQGLRMGVEDETLNVSLQIQQ